MPHTPAAAVNAIAGLMSAHSAGHFGNQPEHYYHRDRAPDHLIIWVIGGRGFAETEGQRSDASPGDLLTFLPGKSHAYGADPRHPWEICWTHFGGSLAGQYMTAIRSFGKPFLSLGLDPMLRSNFDDLIIALTESPTRYASLEDRLDVLSGQMLAGLLGRILHLLSKPDRRPDTGADLNIPRIRRYIHEHLDGPLSLDELAGCVNLSATHFSRLFRRYFGSSPMHYVIQQRMARAASLLAETAAPIKQVAHAVGYDDPYYFSRLFKRTVGLAPGAYRKRAQTPAG